MVKRLSIALAILLILALVATFALPVGATFKLPVVPDSLRLDDQNTIRVLEQQGMDTRYISLLEDYNPAHPYGRIYKDNLSDKLIYEVGGLPMVNAAGQRVVVGWDEIEEGKKFKLKTNVFDAEIEESQVTIEVLNDQPAGDKKTGAKKGNKVTYTPTLYIGGQEIDPLSEAPTLLFIDPINSNYYYNTLEWDYGVVLRRIRIIEGGYQERWIVKSNPGGSVWISHNFEGNLNLDLGLAVDAEGKYLDTEVYGDQELVTITELNKATFPVEIGASLTVYPDAHVETSSVDGDVREQQTPDGVNWATLEGGAGTDAADDNVAMLVGFTAHHLTNGNYVFLYRSIALFDTSALGAGSIVTAATLSVYGEGKTDDTPNSPELNVYASTPNSNTALQADDFVDIDTTPFCDTDITYAAFNTGDPGASSDFIFNAAGRAAIVVNGVSKFGFREVNDDVGAGTPTWGAADETNFRMWTADKGAGYKPKLVITYTPLGGPEVTTDAADDLEDTTATLNGTVTDDGGETVDYYGFVWDTGADQGDPGDTDPSGPPGTWDFGWKSGAGNYGENPFDHAIAGLPTGTTIHFRACAHNVNGWSYGAAASFLTKPAKPTNVAATDGTHPDKVVITWTKSTGATDYHVWRDAVDLGASGDVNTEDDAGADAGTINNAGVVTSSDGTSSAHVVLSLAGESVLKGTTHTYKVVASNATGDSDDSATNTGYRLPSNPTYQWQRSAGDADGGYGNIGGATTDPYNDTAAPEGTISNAGTVTASDGASPLHVTLSLAGEATTVGAGRYYQCIVSATGASNSPQTSDNDRGFRKVGTITYQWQVDDGGGYDNIVGGTTDPYNYTSAPAPTVTPGAASASDGTSGAHVVLSIAGDVGNNGTAYDYQCIVSAVDASNTPQTSDNDDGYRGTAALTYEWFRSAADADAGYASIAGEGGTTDPYNDTNGVVEPDGRWYYCEVSMTGAATQDTTHNRGNKKDVSPSVTTDACTGFGNQWAVLNGTIDDDLGATVTSIGFDYGLTDAYGSSQTATVALATGDTFSLTITGLSAGSNYHFRAKANNGVWGYGGDAVFSTSGSLTLYEHLNDNAVVDGDSGDIYSNKWEAQQFTVGSVSHTVSEIWLYLKRTGAAPGTVTVSIKHADDAHKPTGLDLASATMDGDTLAVAYNWWLFDIDEIGLEAGEEYAIVVRALAGDDANDVQWASDTGGSLANAISSASADGGGSWTVDAGDADYLFELWGDPCIDALGANVFGGYLEDDDMLITFHYLNTYVPYYPDEITSKYFDIRLYDTNGTTLIASTVCRAWGSKPGAIYLNADSAAGLTEGSAYYVKLYGDFTGNPVSAYQLQAVDWRGDDLVQLDDWVIATAHTIATYYDTDMTAFLIGDSGEEVLNTEGGVIFVRGIPALSEVRPGLFELISGIEGYDPEAWTQAFTGETDWDDQLGPTVAAGLTAAGTLFGVDGKAVGVFLLLGFYLGIAIAVVAKGGDSVIAIILAVPFVLLGTWLRLIDIVIVGAVVAVGILLLVYRFWWSRT